jgi:hypothetical protein
MPSFLQKAPNDVLQHIAFICASSSIFQPPSATLRLSQTSRTVHEALSPRRCPQLYAKIFRTRFDISAPLRRLGASRLTASCLTIELVQRCRALRRVRCHEFSTPNLRQDLWTIYCMVLESDGINEHQLTMAGFPNFIVTFLQYCLRDVRADYEVKSLAVWLCCLTLSRRAMISTEMREELLALLRPCAVSLQRVSIQS